MLKLTILVSLTSMVLLAAKDKVPVPKNVETALMNHLSGRLFLIEHDELGDSFSSTFKGLKVYEVWRDTTQTGGARSSVGMGLRLVIVGESVKVFEGDSELRQYLARS